MKPLSAGSEAILVNAPCLSARGREFLGEDVLVHFAVLPHLVPPMLRVHPAGDQAPFYAVSLSDGIRTVLCGHCLRPKPEDASTWSGIAELTGWRPPANSPVNRPTGDHA